MRRHIFIIIMLSLMPTLMPAQSYLKDITHYDCVTEKFETAMAYRRRCGMDNGGGELQA